MLIKRLTIIIYFLIFIVGVVLLKFTNFEYSFDIIIAGLIPIFISLPEMILYKINTRKCIYTNLERLLTQTELAGCTIEFTKKSIPNIPMECIENHYNSINDIGSNLRMCDYNIFILRKGKYKDLLEELNSKISILNVSVSSIKLCIAKYNYDANKEGVNNQEYFDEFNRQIDLMAELYNDIKNILDNYANDSFNSKENNNWNKKKNALKNSSIQEEIRLKI